VEARLGPADPCLLIGYSASSTVAYEAAQQMCSAGRRVHLMLLDAVPRRRGQPSGPDRGVTLRTVSPRGLPAALVRSLQYRWDLVPVLWYERVPGAPRYSSARYRAFARILSRASRSYEPAPAAFPVTLVHVGDDNLVTRAEGLVPDLSVVTVGGDHFTMLLMPEVLKLAAVVGAWATAATASHPVNRGGSGTTTTSGDVTIGTSGSG
jgi:thioesterase domain-containing protein